MADATTSFADLAYYSDVSTTDSESPEQKHQFVPPPVTPELLALLLKQVA